MTNAHLHPSPELLEDFVLGRLELPDNHRVVHHLLTGCARCREITASVWERIEVGLRAARQEPMAAVAGESAVYEEVLDRVLHRASARATTLERERAEAHTLLEELGRHPLPRQLTLVRNSRRFRSWALCELLIRVSFQKRFDDPQESVDLAELAIEVAQRVDEADYGRTLVRDLQGRAHCYLANARRVASDYAGAEEAILEAKRLLGEGTGDPLEKALLARFEGRLAVALRHFDRAYGLLDQATELYRTCGETADEAAMILEKGFALATAERPYEAVPVLEEGLLHLDAEAEPRRVLAARHNLIDCLNESGRHEEALHRLEEMRPAYRELGDRLNLLRLRWLEGKILARLERTHEAEAALFEARDGFLEREAPVDAALVALDIATLYVETARPAEVARLASQILPVFQSRRIERETLATLVAFHQAAQLERVTVDMIREAAARIRSTHR